MRVGSGAYRVHSECKRVRADRHTGTWESKLRVRYGDVAVRDLRSALEQSDGVPAHAAPLNPPRSRSPRANGRLLPFFRFLFLASDPRNRLCGEKKAKSHQKYFVAEFEDDLAISGLIIYSC